MDELIDIYDENNNPVGVQKMKSEAHRTGLWHRAAHVWIYNSAGEILLQLRAKDKEFYPNRWDISAAGHVSAGEEPVVSGLREVKEEIGLPVSKEDLGFFRIGKSKMVYEKMLNNEFYYVYFLKFDGDSSKLRVQEEELQEARFFPVDKIKEGLKTNQDNYVFHGEYWQDVVNHVKKLLSAKV